MHQPRTQTLMLSSDADASADAVTDGNPYFFSAPASPTHFLLSSSPAKPKVYSSFCSADDTIQPNFEFSLAARSMSTAEELFFNGQIRPGFLSADQASSHRRTRSMSPTRTPRTLSREKSKELASHNLDRKLTAAPTATSNSNINASALTSRSSSSNSSASLSSSSSNASSRRWGFVKSLLPLQRSKSEGLTAAAAGPAQSQKQRKGSSNHNINCANGCEGIGHRTSKERQRQRLSADKAETVVPRGKEAVRRRTTFLPYKQQGFLFGCMGFGSRALRR